MTWLDEHRAAALAAFRQRFTDAGWAVFVAGHCSRMIVFGGEDGTVPCGRARRHGWVFCDTHDLMLVSQVDGSVRRVPSTVSAMDLTDIP